MNDSPIPIHTVFQLVIDNIDHFKLVPIIGREKLDPIIDNTYRLRFLEGLGGGEQHLQQCTCVDRQKSNHQ